MGQTSSPSTSNLCRMSVVTENLAIAARDPACRTEILRKIVSEMSQAADGDWEGDVLELARAFAEGIVSEIDMGGLQNWFEHLIFKEGL